MRTCRTAFIAAFAAGAVTAGTAGSAHAATPPADNVVYLQSSQSGATGNRLTLGSFTYQVRMDHGGADFTTVSLVVTAKRGVAGRIDGEYRDTNYLRTDQTSTQFHARVAPSAVFSVTAPANSVKKRFVDFGDQLHVTGSDGTRQTLTGELTANALQSAGNRGGGSFTVKPGA